MLLTLCIRTRCSSGDAFQVLVVHLRYLLQPSLFVSEVLARCPKVFRFKEFYDVVPITLREIVYGSCCFMHSYDLLPQIKGCILQEILTGLNIYVCIGDCDLALKLSDGLNSPHDILRYGGLSLGESRDLINDIAFNPKLDDENGTWLYADETGKLPLPVWVDHVGSKRTVWKQFGLIQKNLETPVPGDPRWILIEN